jgi:hypothetical protein
MSVTMMPIANHSCLLRVSDTCTLAPAKHTMRPILPQTAMADGLATTRRSHKLSTRIIRVSATIQGVKHLPCGDTRPSSGARLSATRTRLATRIFSPREPDTCTLAPASSTMQTTHLLMVTLAGLATISKRSQPWLPWVTSSMNSIQRTSCSSSEFKKVKISSKELFNSFDIYKRL